MNKNNFRTTVGRLKVSLSLPYPKRPLSLLSLNCSGAQMPHMIQA